MPRSIQALGDGDPAEIAGYRLTGVVGEGGQGVVYLGTSGSGHRVAVKLWANPGADDARRFVRQAEAARGVSPSRTAQVLATGFFRERPYLVSEYVDGPTLEELVLAEGPRTGSGLRRLAVATLQALESIHRAGVVHLDLKPANVVLGAEGPVVVDFGIAATAGDPVAEFGVTGTPLYMAPERFAGRAASPAADVFAWAATMVFAASGHHAFRGSTAAAAMHGIVHGEPDLSGVPEDLVAVLARCLAKDPSDRPGVGSLLTDLTARPANVPTDLPTGLGEPAVRESRTRPAVRAGGTKEVDRGRVTVAIGRRRARGRRWAAAGAAVVAVAALVAWPALSKPSGGFRALATIQQAGIGGHTGLAEVNGRPAVITTTAGNLVSVFDATTGRQIGKSFPTVIGKVFHTAIDKDPTVTAGDLDGRPVAVTETGEGGVAVIDLTTGRPRGGTATFGGATAIDYLALTVVRGRLTAVVQAEGIWTLDVATGKADRVVGDPAVRVAVAGLHRPVVVWTNLADALLAFDLATGTSSEISRPGTVAIDRSSTLVAGEAAGRTYALVAHGYPWRVWDVTRPGPAIPLDGYGELETPPIVAAVAGEPAVLAGGPQVSAWSTRDGRPLRAPSLQGPPDQLGQVNGQVVAVTAEAGRVRVWSAGQGGQA